MNPTPFLIILFLLNLMVMFILMYIIIKLKSINKKMANVSYEDVKLITETLKDLVIESERVSERIENSVKEKESLLEDLVALVDSKLKRLESIDVNYQQNIINKEVEDRVDINFSNNINEINLSGMSLKEKVVYLSRNGATPTDIAKRLGISVTEVNLVLKHGR